jgi:hypothetical protein
MPFVSLNYKTHPGAPLNKWVCTRTSLLGPFPAHPAAGQRSNPDYCGQCVSYVTTVCPTLSVRTADWVRGAPVKGNMAIAEGTAIATFDAQGRYKGHAAIYVSQDKGSMLVFDQWITGAAKPVGSRQIGWYSDKLSNHGAGYYVIEG